MTGSPRRQEGLGVRVARALARRSTPPKLWGGLEEELTEELAARRESGQSKWRSTGWLIQEYLTIAARLWWESLRAHRPSTTRSTWDRDLRQAVRGVAARPGLTVSIVGTVMLAVGATTSVYSVVHGVLLQPLPYPESDRLVAAWLIREDFLSSPNETLRAMARGIGPDAPVYEDWASADLGFAALGAYRQVPLVVAGSDGPVVLRGGVATSAVFSVLGVPPLLGRTLDGRDDIRGAPRVVVLSQGFWEERFAGSPGVLGSKLEVGGEPHTVVGVMPSSFALPREAFPYPGLPATEPALWTPLPDNWREGGTSVAVVGRLADGVSLDDANARVGALHAGLVDDARYEGIERTRARLQPVVAWMVGGAGRTLWFLLAAVALVVVVSMVNIAGMLLASGLSRRREYAVRSALGAGRWALVRSQLLESGLLAGVGGALGVGLAVATLDPLVALIPATVPRADAARVSGAVLAISLCATATTAIVVGVLPAWIAGEVAPQAALRGGARGNSGSRGSTSALSLLVVLELAVASVLLVGATLIGSSYGKLSTETPGFETAGLVAATIVPDGRVHPDGGSRLAFAMELQRRLDAVPGMQSAAMNRVPLTGLGSLSPVSVSSLPGESRDVFADIIVGHVGTLDVLGLRVVSGRAFDERDEADAPPVALVTASMERKHWPGGAVGQRLSVVNEGAPREVIGVVADFRVELSRTAEETVILPGVQTRRATQDWAIRTTDPEAAFDALKAALSEVSPTTPIREPRIVRSEIDAAIAIPRLRALLILGLAGLAAGLALIGVYGALAYSVSSRMKETAIRVALGARSRRVFAEVTRSSALLAAAGTLAGLPVALVFAKWTGAFLYEVSPYDPRVYALTSGVLLLVAVAAAWVPARRAARVDPNRLLNQE